VATNTLQDMIARLSGGDQAWSMQKPSAPTEPLSALAILSRISAASQPLGPTPPENVGGEGMATVPPEPAVPQSPGGVTVQDVLNRIGGGLTPNPAARVNAQGIALDPSQRPQAVMLGTDRPQASILPYFPGRQPPVNIRDLQLDGGATMQPGMQADPEYNYRGMARPELGEGMSTGSDIPPAPSYPTGPVQAPIGNDGGVGGMASGADNGWNIPLAMQTEPAPLANPQPDPEQARIRQVIDRLGGRPPAPPAPPAPPQVAPNALDDGISMQRRINSGEFDPARQVAPGDPLITTPDEIDPEYIAAREQARYREALQKRLAGDNASMDELIARGRSGNPIPKGLRGPDDLGGRMARLPDEPDVPGAPDEAEVNAARSASAGIDAMPDTFQPTSGDSPVAQIEIGSPEYQQYLEAQRARIATGMNRPEMRAAGIADTPVHLTNGPNTRRRSPGAAQKAVMAEAQLRTRARRDNADRDRASRNEAYAKAQFLGRTGAAGLNAINAPEIERGKQDTIRYGVDAQVRQKQMEFEQRSADRKAEFEQLQRNSDALLQQGAQQHDEKMLTIKADMERLRISEQKDRAMQERQLRNDEATQKLERDKQEKGGFLERAAAERDAREAAKAQKNEAIETTAADHNLPVPVARRIQSITDPEQRQAELEGAVGRQTDALIERLAPFLGGPAGVWGANKLRKRRIAKSLEDRLGEQGAANAADEIPWWHQIPGSQLFR
jgi:hypothetical protein